MKDFPNRRFPTPPFIGAGEVLNGANENQNPTERPPTMTHENQQNPVQPLPNDEHEAFAQFVCAGLTVTEAYQKARPGRTPRVTAASQGSRWQARPEIADRIRELHLQRAKGQKTPETPPQAQHTPARVAPSLQDADPITRVELFRLISGAIKDGDRVDPALVTALLKVAPELGEVDQSRPDPTAVITYVCHFAGRPGHDIVRELGGLEFIASKLCDVLKVNPPELAEAVGRLSANVNAHPEPTPPRTL